MAKRRYSDKDKAESLAVLDANGGNVAKTSRDTSIPSNTLIDWRDGRGVVSEVTEIRCENRKALAEHLEDIAYKIVEAIPDKIGEANLVQLSTSLGISVDKMQLLRGKATAINEDASLSDEGRVARLAGLLDAARARRDGRPIVPSIPIQDISERPGTIRAH